MTAERCAKKDKNFEKRKTSGYFKYTYGSGVDYKKYPRAKKVVSNSKKKRMCSTCGDPVHGKKAQYLCMKNTSIFHHNAVFQGLHEDTYVYNKTLLKKYGRRGDIGSSSTIMVDEITSDLRATLYTMLKSPIRLIARYNKLYMYGNFSHYLV